MNREIKFRAWDMKKKQMLTIFDSSVGSDWYLPSWKENYKVMQYTGLTDKNGTEIYEGDVVHYKSTIDQFGFPLTHEQTGVIGVNKGMTGFTGKTTQIYKDEVNTHGSKFLFLSPDIYEVVGNVFENNELLKQF